MTIEFVYGALLALAGVGVYHLTDYLIDIHDKIVRLKDRTDNIAMRCDMTNRRIDSIKDEIWKLQNPPFTNDAFNEEAE